MHRDALLGAIRRDEQQRLLAEREHRLLAEEMHRNDRRARRNGLHAIGDGRNGFACRTCGSSASLPEGRVRKGGWGVE